MKLIIALLFSMVVTQANSEKENFQINGISVKPKKEFDLQKLEVFNDKLTLVTCEKFVYEPFGSIQKKSEIQTSQLKKFAVTDKTVKSDPTSKVYSLLLKKSRVLLFLERGNEGPISSYLIKGEIYDPEVLFEKSIRISMSKQRFILKFFDQFPESLSKNFNTIVLSSCVEGTNHTYFFKSNVLHSVSFLSDFSMTSNIQY